MKLLRNGKLLFVALAFVLSGCPWNVRQDQPPPVEVCIGDGAGGANCVSKSGERLYRPPSQLNRYWMTNQRDMGRFSAWCYGTDVKTAEKFLKFQLEQIQ